MRTEIFNDTTYSLYYTWKWHTVDDSVLRPMKSCLVSVDPRETYHEVTFSNGIGAEVIISNDDALGAKEIRIYEIPGSGIVFRVSVSRYSTDALRPLQRLKRAFPKDVTTISDEKFGLPLFARALKDASTRMKLVERLSLKMEELLREIKVFHYQCNFLSQTFLTGIQEVKETYLLVSKDQNLMWTLYASKKLSQVINSLDSLLRDLMSAERLLQVCGGKEWKSVALILSMPPPELEKYSGSRFFLLIREFNWSLDLVWHSLRLPEGLKLSTATEQTLSREELMNLKKSGLTRDQGGEEWKFEWCDHRCGYKLQRNVHASERLVESHEDADHQASECKDEIRVAISEVRSQEDDNYEQASDCKDVTGVAAGIEESLKCDFDRQARDRKNLPGNVEKTLTAFTHGSSRWLWAWQIISNKFVADGALRNKLLAVVKNRCQDTSGSSSSNLISKCFEIDYMDLKMKKHISGGASKRIYRANWLRQEVAVAVVKHIPRDVVQKEAGFLVKVHHPNVVDFFGFALTEEALTEEEMNAVEKIEPTCTGFLVMELMQEDLRNLIDKLLRGRQKQEYGGPFSLSITVDMLLQIVAAMIHTHKFDILHRDLKAKNCLVSPKLVSSSTAQDVSTQYYTVKLIDFGESKLWAVDGKQTLKKGTVRWMAPEVWQSSEYSKSADVYSFGMTCYEIVTGRIPFQGIPYRVMDKVLEGIRPTIPGTCPQSLSDLMKKCWAHVPKDRPTFEEIQKDLWAIKYSVDVQA